MNNKKHLFFTTASFAVFSGLILGGLFGWNKAVVNWIPEKIEEQQFIGTSQVINTTFKSAKDLKNVTFWLTPGLERYVKTEPQTIGEVKKDQEYPVSIIVSIPTDFGIKKYNKDNLKENLKTFLQKDFNEEDYKNFKEYEEFLNEFSSDKIKGLIFVVSEEQKFWSKFSKQKYFVKKPYPQPLRVVIGVKEATAEEIPINEVALPIPERIYEDEETGAIYVRDEIIIGFKEGTSEERIKEIVSEVNGVFLGSIMVLDAYQIRVPVFNSSELLMIIQQLESLPEVKITTYHWLDEAY